ncbi:MAG: GDP-mannose 4,6-dehydratase [Thermoleophilia bacterium]|nr:GDP-mannose 4,6-dehydratase [Thermoleophilia bacterium]
MATTAREPSAPEAGPLRSLVTGGAGFIGSHLCDRLLARGDRVTVIDNLSTGRRSNLPAAHAGLRFIEADLSSALDAFGPGERFDQIYHLAAAVGVRLVVDDPIGCIRTNIDDTARLLSFALTHGPGGGPAATLIASSSEVYGKAETSPFSEEADVVYGPTTRSRWSYACSKAIDEYLALAHHEKHGLPVVVARFFNTVGPRQVGAYGMVLPNFVSSALAGEAVRVFGDGEQSRCFCDVRDVTEALPRMLASPACVGRVFNVGSDRPISMNALAGLVISTLSSRSGVVHIPYDRAYSAGFEDLRRREPDLRRIREAVGFQSRVALEQTIRDLAAWIRDGQSEASTR